MNINWTPDDSPAGERSRGVESDLGPALYVKRGRPGRLGGSGQGASLSMPVTIDNTAPTLDGVSVDPHPEDDDGESS